MILNIEEKKESYEDFIKNMCGAWKDDARTTEEIIEEIRNSRQFGVTRHIGQPLQTAFRLKIYILPKIETTVKETHILEDLNITFLLKEK